MQIKKMWFIPILVVAMIGCSWETSYEEALKKNQDKIADTRQLEDANFLVEAKSMNLLATGLSTLASDSGYSSIVVSFAKKKLEDHKSLDKDIQAIAKKKNVTLPTRMSAAHNRLLNELSTAKREHFDIAFSRIIRQVNDRNTTLYVTKATEAFDPDVRAFAARKLDLLRAHSEAIVNIEKQLLQTF